MKFEQALKCLQNLLLERGVELWHVVMLMQWQHMSDYTKNSLKNIRYVCDFSAGQNKWNKKDFVKSHPFRESSPLVTHACMCPTNSLNLNPLVGCHKKGKTREQKREDISRNFLYFHLSSLTGLGTGLESSSIPSGSVSRENYSFLGTNICFKSKPAVNSLFDGNFKHRLLPLGRVGGYRLRIVALHSVWDKVLLKFYSRLWYQNKSKR